MRRSDGRKYLEESELDTLESPDPDVVYECTATTAIARPEVDRKQAVKGNAEDAHNTIPR